MYILIFHNGECNKMFILYTLSWSPQQKNTTSNILSIEWNPSKPATLGTSESVLIRGMATFQGSCMIRGIAKPLEFLITLGSSTKKKTSVHGPYYTAEL